MKDKAFVIGDVHGMYDMLEALLLEWDKEEEQLIFVGDYIDRGPKIRETIDLVRRLQIDGAWLLSGNHERMLLEFLNQPEIFWGRYERNSGMTTLSALTGKSADFLQKLSVKELSQYLRAQQPWLLGWLSELPLYVEFGKWCIVHAGVDLTKEHWKNTKPHDFYWIREPFHVADNTTDRQFIFGHTPLQNLNERLNDLSIWHHQGKYGIDGGAVYGGDLIGMHIHQDGRILGESRIKPMN